MAGNKQIIFGLEDKPVLQPQPVAAEQQVAATEQNQVQTNTKDQDKQKDAKDAKDQKRSKDSDLGVRVVMKQVTASPVPHVLPSTQPNQPVIALGQQVLPIAAVGMQMPVAFNPATKHPATITNNTNQPPVKSKTRTFKPDTTHPAILPPPTKSTKKKKITKKQGFVDFKKRLEMKNAMIAKKAEMDAAAAAAENMKQNDGTGKRKKTKKSITRGAVKTSRRSTSKKAKENQLF